METAMVGNSPGETVDLFQQLSGSIRLMKGLSRGSTPPRVLCILEIYHLDLTSAAMRPEQAMPITSSDCPPLKTARNLQSNCVATVATHARVALSCRM